MGARCLCPGLLILCIMREIIRPIAAQSQIRFVQILPCLPWTTTDRALASLRPYLGDFHCRVLASLSRAHFGVDNLIVGGLSKPNGVLDAINVAITVKVFKDQG